MACGTFTRRFFVRLGKMFPSISRSFTPGSPEVTNAWDIMDSIWMNPDYVYGGPAYIATTRFQDAPEEGDRLP